MKREILDYLEDIKQECEYLMTKSDVIDYDTFLLNEDLKRAFVRSLEIIGEAAKQLPEELRKSYSIIPWQKIIGMRNILTHEYFGINYEVIWKTVKERIPELNETIRTVIKRVKGNGESKQKHCSNL